jgi:hypothetical protein
MKEPIVDREKWRIAEAVKAACAQAGLEAFEHAAISGLCFEGSLECAVGAIQAVNVGEIIRELDDGE